MKLCKDCRWCKLDHAVPRYSMCQHPEVQYPGMQDYVTGQTVKPIKQLCNSARDDENLCGRDGRYWEAHA